MTGFTMLLHLPERHGALEVQEAMIAKMAQLPQELKKTLTWDQGLCCADRLIPPGDRPAEDRYRTRCPSPLIPVRRIRRSAII